MAIACSSTPKESDPLYEGSPSSEISTKQVSEWNQAYAWGDHADAGYLKAESDPLFSSSAARSIAAGDVSNWNTAFSWGDHAAAGYLKTESDPLFSASAAGSIAAGDVSNWNTAFAWGDHAAAGYLKTESDPKIGALSTSDVPRWDGQQLQTGSIRDTGAEVSVGVGAAVIDQDQEQQTAYYQLNSGLTQSFTAGLSGQLVSFDVGYAFPGSFTFAVQTLAQQTLASGSCTASAGGWVNCTLPTAVAVTAGTQYILALAPIAPNNLYTYIDTQNPYGGGNLSTDSSFDLQFRTYVQLSALDVTSKVNINTMLHLAPLPSAPASATAGDVYFDSGLKKLRYFDGTSWVSL